MIDFSSLMQKAKESNEYWESKVKHKLALALLDQLESSGLSQADFARRAEVSPAYISRVLSGNENLSIRTMIKLTRVLGLSIDVDVRPTVPVITRIPDADGSLPSDWSSLARQSQFRKNQGSPSLRLVEASDAMNETAYSSVVTTRELFSVAA